MRIEMRRSGGFTGRIVTITLDTDQLPAARAARLRQLVASVDLSRLGPATFTTNGADLMRYDLTVTDGARVYALGGAFGAALFGAIPQTTTASPRSSGRPSPSWRPLSCPPWP